MGICCDNEIRYPVNRLRDSEKRSMKGKIREREHLAI